MTYITIFASGGGSNAAEICRYFQEHPSIRVGLIITNRKKAGVLQVASDFNIPAHALSSEMLNDRHQLLSLLQSYRTDYIILAGYLKLIPSWLVETYPHKILNIHPSLLPKYGGQGMYGMHVHQAVKSNGETQSGMTIHHVNEAFDQGGIIFQASVPISSDMSAEEIAKAVLVLEHQHYAPTIEKFIMGV